jgi:UDP-glucose 4-epimerase
MKVLVTGATGFIGSHVAVCLARAGHLVLATGRNAQKVPALGHVQGISLARLDLADRKEWKQQLAGCEALVHVALGWGDDGPMMLENDTAASVALFEAARAAGVKRVVVTSSTAANGEMRALNSEDQAPRPMDFYGATKAATEMYARAYAQKGLQIQVIRPGYIFGEPAVEGGRSQMDLRFAQICQNVRDRKPVRLVKHDGTQFLHAADIARVYLAALSHPATFSIHYALSHAWQSWEAVARMAMQEAGVQAQLELEDRGYGPQPYLFDVSALERDFGLRFDNWERLKAHVRWQLGRQA